VPIVSYLMLLQLDSRRSQSHSRYNVDTVNYILTTSKLSFRSVVDAPRGYARYEKFMRRLILCGFAVSLTNP
jgi:hypothetical protein